MDPSRTGKSVAAPLAAVRAAKERQTAALDEAERLVGAGQQAKRAELFEALRELVVSTWEERQVNARYENKTDHPRWWTVTTGTANALRWWYRQQGEPESSERIFQDEHGRPILPAHPADLARDHLRKAGITRDDLFSVKRSKGELAKGASGGTASGGRS